MSALDKYRQKFSPNRTSISDSFKHSTKQSTLRLFRNSPSLIQIEINGTLKNAITEEAEKPDHKVVRLEPDEVISNGDVIKLNSKDYLVTESYVDDLGLYPKATIQLCNSTFPIKGGVTETLIGYSERGEPVYDTTDSPPLSIPCIVENKIYQGNNNQAIELPENSIHVTISYMEHEDIVEGKEFNMYGGTYQIRSLDRTKVVNDKGLLTIVAQRRV